MCFPAKIADERLWKWTSRRDGLTLIELMAVVAVVTILAIFVFPTLNSIYDKSLAVKCLGNLRNFGVVLLSFAAENGGLPPSPRPGEPDRPGTRPKDFQGWYKEQSGQEPPRCPLMPKSGPEKNKGFYYTGNSELPMRYPTLHSIPVPSSRVVFAAERNYSSGFNDSTHFNGTIWGTGTGLPDDGKKEGSGSGVYPSKPHYHGSKEERGLHFFFLDGHAKRLIPEDNNWKKPPIYGIQTTSEVPQRVSKNQDIGYFYDQRHFSRMVNGTLNLQ